MPLLNSFLRSDMKISKSGPPLIKKAGSAPEYISPPNCKLYREDIFTQGLHISFPKIAYLLQVFVKGYENISSTSVPNEFLF